MCNKVHLSHEGYQETIKRKGRGWKLFRRNTVDGSLQALVERASYTTKEKDNSGWVEWDEIRNPSLTCPNQEKGFCFFTTKRKAEQGFKAWEEGSWDHGLGMELHPIKYEGGLVEQDEIHFVSGHRIRIALCKRFLILSRKEKVFHGKEEKVLPVPEESNLPNQ